MSKFTYTAEETNHLRELLFDIGMTCTFGAMQPELSDPKYLRDEAERMVEREAEERAAIRSGRYCPPLPSADDCFATVPTDLLEEADGIECDFFRGEHL